MAVVEVLPLIARAARLAESAAPFSRTLAEVERDHIVATLEATNGVLGGWDGAAARLRLPRTTLISRCSGSASRPFAVWEVCRPTRGLAGGARWDCRSWSGNPLRH